MSGTAQYAIGAEVTCADGVCGDLTRVVVDPVARALTHLVVEPKHRQGQARLVPIAMVQETDGAIRLACGAAEFDALEYAEETHFLPDAGELGASGASGEPVEQLGYSSGQVLAWPYYGLGGMGGMGMGGMGLGNPPMPMAVIEDRVPPGEVEVRRGEPVHASDGSIGRVQGLVIDPADHRVTHVLLQEGHLWGKHQVAIPIGAVTAVDVDGVQLSLTKDEVRALPPVELAGHI